jgi:hypothetical protein
MTGEKLFEGLLGRSVAVVRHDHSWEFSFGDGQTLTVETLWRLCAERVLLTSEDDGQQFGLPQVIDAEHEANIALSGAAICACDGNSITGDLRIVLDNGAKLEVISTSSGYESWVIKLDHRMIVGRGDGLVVFEGER